MSENIKKMYRRAGLKAPDGKGVHTSRAHSCVIEYLKKGFSKNEAWKRCMGGLGRNLAVKKSHWK
jgi:hypothetical protein